MPSATVPSIVSLPEPAIDRSSRLNNAAFAASSVLASLTVSVPPARWFSLPSASQTIVSFACSTRIAADDELMMSTPSSTRRTLASPASTTTWPSVSVPLIR